MHSLIYQTPQIRQLEQLAQTQLHLSEENMMQRAGMAACDYLLKRWPDVKSVSIFCGTGNNGGDGYVLADLLGQENVNVTIWQTGAPSAEKPAAYAAFLRCQKSGMTIRQIEKESDFGKPELIVDAIYGIG